MAETDRQKMNEQYFRLTIKNSKIRYATPVHSIAGGFFFKTKYPRARAQDTKDQRKQERYEERRHKLLNVPLQTKVANNSTSSFLWLRPFMYHVFPAPQVASALAAPAPFAIRELTLIQMNVEASMAQNDEYERYQDEQSCWWLVGSMVASVANELGDYSG